MGQEIERKFLIKKDIWKNATKEKASYLKQGYISTDPGKTIRVRIAEDKSFLTIKGKSEGIARAEFEYEIPTEDANELLNLFASNCIEKVRHEIVYDGKLWEVDVFSGDNEGLIIAEIELDSVDENFALPAWIDKEVSGDERYFNSNLSKNPFKKWES